MADQKFAIKMPGRVAQKMAERAIRNMEFGRDKDVCEAVSNVRLKRRGTGFSATVALTIDQAERLALWIKAGDPKWLRDWRDQLKLNVKATAAVNTDTEG